jgi:probable rRNA maturation factor
MKPVVQRRPPLSLSLQFADPRHRAQLPRHKVARWIRAALERPARSRCASSTPTKAAR